MSVGSPAAMTKDQLMETRYNLVNNSGARFLWIQIPGSIAVSVVEGDEIPEELVKATEERSYIVGWAPREEVFGPCWNCWVFGSQRLELNNAGECSGGSSK